MDGLDQRRSLTRTSVTRTYQLDKPCRTLKVATRVRIPLGLLSFKARYAELRVANMDTALVHRSGQFNFLTREFVELVKERRIPLLEADAFNVGLGHCDLAVALVEQFEFRAPPAPCPRFRRISRFGPRSPVL